MVKKKKILAIPHIGSAFGHFFRLATFLNDYVNDSSIYVLIPGQYIEYCKRFLHPDISIIPRHIHCSISGSSGIIDKECYISLLEENEKIFNKIQPELLIGDPGVQAAILATKYSKPWIGLMHGCYLPFPENLSMCKMHSLLLRRVWNTLNDQMDKLVSVGTGKAFHSWQEIQKTGTIIIPNLRENEPSKIGEYIDLNRKVNNAWDVYNKVELLITCCSAGTVSPSDDFLKKLSKSSKSKIFVAGIKAKEDQPNIIYVGNNINYKYLVNENTTVITHGGHGTLQAISKANKVFIIPGDLDQLYNSIIASTIKGWHLVFDKNWLDILDSVKLFKREIHWDNLVIENLNGDIEIKGLEIFQEKITLSNSIAF